MEDSLLVLESSRTGCRIDVYPPGKIIGRADFFGDGDIEVSRQHARIYFQGGHWRIRDLGSTNGTTVNHCPVEDCLLSKGDRIGFGGMDCLVTENSDPDALTARAKELVVSLFDRSRKEKAGAVSQSRAA